MNAVLGMTGLLLETPLNPEQRDFVETIRISGDALLSLINEILDLSKLEAGEMMLETLDFDLSTCVEEVLDLLAPQAHTKNLEIAALINRDVPTKIQGDVSRLRQILMNLISNAIKFTSSGEILVRAELKSESSTTATIYFAVIDTGLGISPENQSQLFQPFIQVDASINRKYGGTGLGLAICKQLVNLMGGNIGVDSQLGKGAKFWFELTFSKQSLSVSPVKEVELLTNHRLLIVDDNITNRKIIYHQVTRWGMQVDEAATANVALKALAESVEQGKPYDLALINMQIPEIDGITLGTQLKANSATNKIPLILLTATNQRDEVERAINLGFSGYLAKPIKASRLFDSIMNILGSQLDLENFKDYKIKQNLLTTEIQQSPSTTKFKLRLLLAENNLVNQKVALKQLRNLGYDADVAANGEEVLQLIETVPYDLILMDCQMPILDGLETTKEIRRRPDRFFASRCQPIVVAMTANAMKEDEQNCRDAGMDDYVSKPVRKDKLTMVLEHWSQIILSQQELFVTKTIVFPLEESSLEDLINWQQLHQISDNNPEFEWQLLQIYTEDSISRLDAIKAALATKDFQKMRGEVHQLRSSMGYIGTTTVQETVEQLEQLAVQDERRGTGKLIQDLEYFVNRIQEFLTTR
nr:response regulator [Gloeotrichia echinulata DEX184]